MRVRFKLKLPSEVSFRVPRVQLTLHEALRDRADEAGFLPGNHVHAPTQPSAVIPEY